MSMPIISAPDNPIDREQSINDLIESVALMETGLSHVINAEGEKIQKVVDPDADYEIEEIISVNHSAEKMINTISKLEMILQSKLDISKGLDQRTTPEQIRSSYAEGAGSTQTVPQNGTIAFDDYDIVGTGITATNNEFTINTPGLYLIEWTVNLADGNPVSLIGILENGLSASAATNSAAVGNTSSGTLIHVEDVPFTISLLNYGPEIILEDYPQTEGTAASIRIMKFADAPSI